jgi:hypothetical protein
MTERGFRKTKSDITYFLDIRLTKSRSDYIDLEGRLVIRPDLNTWEDVGGWEDRSEKNV